MLAPVRTTVFRTAKVLPRTMWTSSSAPPQQNSNFVAYVSLWAGIGAVGLTYYLAYGDQNAKAKMMPERPLREGLKFSN